MCEEIFVGELIALTAHKIQREAVERHVLKSPAQVDWRVLRARDILNN